MQALKIFFLFLDHVMAEKIVLEIQPNKKFARLK